MLGRFLFEDANLLFLGFGQEWRNFSYQNTATKVCSKPSQATKMQDAQRLHLAYHDIPKKNSLETPARSPNPKPIPIQGTSPPEKAPSHSHPLTTAYKDLCTNMCSQQFFNIQGQRLYLTDFSSIIQFPKTKLIED